MELEAGELRTVYQETGYDLESSKPVSEEWLSDNAVGRHSFVELDPPGDIPADELSEYAARELRG